MGGASEGLPSVDEHAREIGAPAEAVWAALGRMLASQLGGKDAIARALGARPHRSAGDPLHEGSTLPGFDVVRAVPDEELALTGRHRFSRYALTFRLDRLADGRTRLRAETRAAFPGLHGTAYRAMVIGSRGHVVAVRRMLAGVARRAERDGGQSPSSNR